MTRRENLILDFSSRTNSKIENLDKLKELKKLYLSANRIEIVENLENNTQLKGSTFTRG